MGYPDSASQHRGRELLRIEMYVDVEFTSPSGVGPVVRERRCDRSEPEEEDQIAATLKVYGRFRASFTIHILRLRPKVVVL